MSTLEDQIRPRYEDRLMRVIDYIYAHLDGDLSLDALADVAAMSRFHWHRIYRGLASETIAETIRRVRLNRAARELVHTRDPVVVIAERCGYPTRRSFERAFAETYRVTPIRFRALGKPAAPLSPLQGRLSANLEVGVALRNCPPQRIAALLHVGPFEEIGGTMHKVLALAAMRGMQAVGPPLAVFLSDPDLVPPHERRAQVGVPVSPKTHLLPPFRAVTVEGGRYAVGSYRGPYAGLPQAWDWFCSHWLAEFAGDLRDAPCFEVYCDDPNELGPNAVLTEMYLPVTH